MSTMPRPPRYGSSMGGDERGSGGSKPGGAAAALGLRKAGLLQVGASKSLSTETGLGWRSALSQGYLPPMGSGLGLPTSLQCLPTRNHTRGPVSPFLPNPCNSPFHSGSPLVTLAGPLIFPSTQPSFPILGL